MPAVPTLSITDNGDNTGATATISGSTALSTNILYTQVVSGALGTGTWTNSGNRTADGTISLSLAVGYYWGQCKSSLGGSDAWSSPFYFNVTDGVSSLHYQCLLAIQAAIRGLVLDDIASDSIIIRKIPLDKWLASPEALARFQAQGKTTTGYVELPAIIICPVKEKMDPKAGPIGLNEVTYGIAVASIRKDDMEPTLVADLPEMLLQRQKLTNRFIDQYLSGISRINETWIEPTDFPNFAAWKNNLLVDSFVVRARCWLLRP